MEKNEKVCSKCENCEYFKAVFSDSEKRICLCWQGCDYWPKKEV